MTPFGWWIMWSVIAVTGVAAGVGFGAVGLFAWALGAAAALSANEFNEDIHRQGEVEPIIASGEDSGPVSGLPARQATNHVDRQICPQDTCDQGPTYEFRGLSFGGELSAARA